MAISVTTRRRGPRSARVARVTWHAIWIVVAIGSLCHPVLATEIPDDDPPPEATEPAQITTPSSTAAPAASDAANDDVPRPVSDKTLSPGNGVTDAAKGEKAGASAPGPLAPAPGQAPQAAPLERVDAAKAATPPPARSTATEDSAAPPQTATPSPTPTDPAQTQPQAGPDGAVSASNPPRAPTTDRPPTEGSQAAAPFKLLGAEVPPGEVRKLSWVANQHYSGIESPTPVLVAHGSQPGRVLCITAAIHGDEINGIEIARRVFYKTDPKDLLGTLVVVPIVNLHGFERGYRYLADRRDLNRYFPGIADRSSAARIAHSFFTNVIQHCHALVDLHTGSFHRTNLPQLRANLSNSAVLHLTQGFGATAVLNDKGAFGTLRRAATDAGIPAVVLEAGEPMRFQPDEVGHGTKAVESLMFHLGMVEKTWHWGEPQPVYYEAIWVRASQGGILMAAVQPGDTVGSGQLLGTVTDPISNSRIRILSPQAGRILGRAVNQMVMPGYAVFRIGIERTEAEIVKEAEPPPVTETRPPAEPVAPAVAGNAAQENGGSPNEEPDIHHADE